MQKTEMHIFSGLSSKFSHLCSQQRLVLPEEPLCSSLSIRRCVCAQPLTELCCSCGWPQTLLTLIWTGLFTSWLDLRPALSLMVSWWSGLLADPACCHCSGPLCSLCSASFMALTLIHGDTACDCLALFHPQPWARFSIKSSLPLLFPKETEVW